MVAEGVLEVCRERVDKRLEGLLPPLGEEPSELHAAMRYACLAPGKRLRPALCMTSASAVGGSAEAVLDAACAVEMVHAFSLVHDDLPAIDDDRLRRGQPSCHAKFGEALALLAGDALFSLAFRTLAAAKHPAQMVLAAIRSLSEAAGSNGLVGGEVMDVLAEGSASRREGVEAIHRRKTAALIGSACEIGGILGGGGDGQVATLKSFGENVGLAFQIADDILDVTATSEEMGKTTGADLERRKATYPGKFGIPRSRELAKEALDAALLALRRSEIRSEDLDSIARYAVERTR